MISYPRVANDYMQAHGFFSSPHAKMSVFDDFSKSLNHESYPLNKKTAILELTNVEILTPATIENVFETIDSYFDDDLDIKVEMKKSLYSLLEEFDSYVKKKDKDITVNDLCKDGNILNSSAPMHVFKIEVSSSGEQSKEKYKKKKERVSNFKENLVTSKAISLSEVVCLVHNKKKGNRKKAEREMFDVFPDKESSNSLGPNF